MEENNREFLQEQIELIRQIKDGESTWNDLNNYRVENGYANLNTDSLRRRCQELMVYDEAGLISDEGAVGNAYTNRSKKQTTMMNCETNETISEKIIDLDESQLFDKEELMMAHGFDPSEWILKSVSNSKVERYGVTGNSESYSSRLIVRPMDGLVKEIDLIAKELEGFKSPVLKKKKEVYDATEDLLIPLYDLHWGRLKDDENLKGYDIEEEKNKIIEHVQKYITKFKKRKFNKVYLIVGQDFLNSSFTGYTSSQSHLQDNAVDFRTMFKTGAQLLISLIDMFADTCNDLQVIGSLGNHDVAEEVALFELLKAYYRNSDNITVDSGTAPRKYLEIGNSCVGLGHADKEKDRLYGLMQSEVPEIWARTKTHVFVTGHLHHFEVNSKQGVEVYRVPSICPLDRWTREQGYTMNRPKTMCFIFDEDEGLSETHFMYL